MGVLERHQAVLASWGLRKRLGRRHPGNFIYGGISASEPHVLLVRSDTEIDVPETFKFDGIEYDVVYEVRDNDGSTSSTSEVCESLEQREASDTRQRGSRGAGPVCSGTNKHYAGRDSSSVDRTEDGAAEGLRSSSEESFGPGSQKLCLGIE